MVEGFPEIIPEKPEFELLNLWEAAGKMMLL
jgi:hypothetical protein